VLTPGDRVVSSEPMHTDKERPEQEPDLEYDLAHERTGGDGPSKPDESPDRVQVATETPGYDGDYGYDLAHDVPGR
jgi:hypothetical protein